MDLKVVCIYLNFNNNKKLHWRLEVDLRWIISTRGSSDTQPAGEHSENHLIFSVVRRRSIGESTKIISTLF